MSRGGRVGYRDVIQHGSHCMLPMTVFWHGCAMITQQRDIKSVYSHAGCFASLHYFSAGSLGFELALPRWHFYSWYTRWLHDVMEGFAVTRRTVHTARSGLLELLNDEHPFA